MMSKISRAYRESRFGQIHYRIALPSGPVTAPPLLCLHQTPSDGRDWAPVMPALSQNRVVIAADTPGYGQSDSPPEPVLIDDYARVMLQLMDDLAADGIIPAGQFDVMGFHTGSLISTELARSYPDRVRRVVLFGLAAYEADKRAEKLANLPVMFPPPGPDLKHVEKLWGIIGQLSDPRVGFEERHVNMAECLRLGARMPWGYISVYKYDFLGAMTQVEQPVLVMNPQDDLWEVTSATSHNYRNGTRYDMPGVKHGVLSLEHDRVIAVIEGFLQAA
jgi:pimeloyl-ACP methyl ester carboxylesterase